jgi:membrane-associated phospholipid phosphatase
VEAVLAQDRAVAARAGLDAAARDRADSLGRAAAAQVFARVQGDGDGAAWQGNLPTGSGMWTSAPDMKPMGATWGQVRPWVLARADQFRPAPPPAVGTPAFTRALAEVRSAVANLTPAQRASAVKWAATGMPTYWNEVAVDLITKDRVPGPRAIEVLTALNVALMDANIACFDAKYHYWGIRPSQADTTIELPVPLPNFPAYPSGHACLSEAAATVLGHYFPAQRAQLLATSQEVGMARLYGGVHYRHDNEVGAAMGRQVAQAVLAAASRGVGQLASR